LLYISEFAPGLLFWLKSYLMECQKCQ